MALVTSAPHPQHVTCTHSSPELGHSLAAPSLHHLPGPSTRELPWSSSSLAPSWDQPSCGHSLSGPPGTAPGGGAGGDGPGPSLDPAPLCATWSFLLCHACLGQQALSRPSAALRAPRSWGGRVGEEETGMGMGGGQAQKGRLGHPWQMGVTQLHRRSGPAPARSGGGASSRLQTHVKVSSIIHGHLEELPACFQQPSSFTQRAACGPSG